LGITAETFLRRFENSHAIAAIPVVARIVPAHGSGTTSKFMLTAATSIQDERIAKRK
jgi:hypothetical protein